MDCGQDFPEGVLLRNLATHVDPRGELFELFRTDRDAIAAPLQWNVVHCTANSLRGFHLHPVHTDYLVVLSGRFTFAVKDFRPDSPTFNQAVVFELDGDRPQALTIPPGVAHGFVCRDAGTQIYGMSQAWDPLDDLTCRWDDPDLGFRLDVESPILSDRDRDAGTVAALREAYSALLAGETAAV